MRHDSEVSGDLEHGGYDPTVKPVHRVEHIGARREADAPATVDTLHERRFQETQERHRKRASTPPVDLIGRDLSWRGHVCILKPR